MQDRMYFIILAKIITIVQTYVSVASIDVHINIQTLQIHKKYNNSAYM